MLSRYFNNVSITWRIAISIVAASMLISTLTTASMIWLNVAEEERHFHQWVNEIRTSHMTSLASALWHLDDKQVRVQADGILNLYYIGYVKIISEGNVMFEKGIRSENMEADHFILPVKYAQRIIGELEIGFDRTTVLSNILDSARQVVYMQLLSSALLATLLFWTIRQVVTRHLVDLKQQLNHTDTDHDNPSEIRNRKPLTLQRKPGDDELSALVTAFNDLQQQIVHELDSKEEAQKLLAETNSRLEQRVAERTANLQDAVDELHDTLRDLRSTQSQLIESEKLSSLGSMVAGVAHEINTPVGLCITTHSFIQDSLDEMNRKFANDQLSVSDFESFMSSMNESVSILSKNLQRAANLIKSFKHVSEDQTGEALRKFGLSEYIHEILSTLHPKLKSTEHKVIIRCPEDLQIESFPGALSQVITNLVMNTLIHGFEHTNAGHIHIDAQKRGDMIEILYTDDGKGLTEEAQAHIFEPFYTTKRGHGGTGLGMHLVYNLVNQKLQGNIQVHQASQGCAFMITVPERVEPSPETGKEKKNQ